MSSSHPDRQHRGLTLAVLSLALSFLTVVIALVLASLASLAVPGRRNARELVPHRGVPVAESA
jgi:hypothetical protein